MELKKTFPYLLVIFLGIVILNLSTELYLVSERAAKVDNGSLVVRVHMLRVLCGFALGCLVNWRLILEYFNGNINIGLKVLPGMLILAISLLPPAWVLAKFAIHAPFGASPVSWLVAPLLSGSNQLLLSVIAGFLVTKGLYESK